MVVTNVLEYGDNVPHNAALVMIPAHALQELYLANREINGAHAVAHPVDADAINRGRGREQGRRANDCNMTNLSPVRWAQEQLSIERLGATGQWLYGVQQHWAPGKLVTDRDQVMTRPVYSYRRWAEL